MNIFIPLNIYILLLLICIEKWKCQLCKYINNIKTIHPIKNTFKEEIKQPGENKVARDKGGMHPGRSGFWVKIADKLGEESRKWDKRKDGKRVKECKWPTGEKSRAHQGKRDTLSSTYIYCQRPFKNKHMHPTWRRGRSGCTCNPLCFPGWSVSRTLPWHPAPVGNTGILPALWGGASSAPLL